jgi:Peptidase inhibitor I78 family
MRLHAVILAIVMAAAWLASACGTTDTITAPSSAPAAEGSLPQGRETPPPSTPQPAPPPVNRDPIQPVPPPLPPASGTCDATKAQWAIGERASAELLERARLAAAAGSARFLRPNDRITLEFLASRLNLGLNEQDVVRSVSCG